MPSSGFRRPSYRGVNVWPGWVDALSSLVMVVIFLLMVFVVAQFYLTAALSGREAALGDLSRRIGTLNDQLSLEREAASALRTQVGSLAQELEKAQAAREDVRRQVQTLETERDSLAGRIRHLDEQLALAAQTMRDLDAAYKTIAEDRKTIEQHLWSIGGLNEDLRTLRAQRAGLEQRITSLTQTLEAENDRRAWLEAQIADAVLERNRTAAALKNADARAAELAARLTTAEAAMQDSQAAQQQALSRTAALEKELVTRDAEIARFKDELTARTSETARLKDELVALKAEAVRDADARKTLTSERDDWQARARAAQTQLTELAERLGIAEQDRIAHNRRIADSRAENASQTAALETALEAERDSNQRATQQISLLNQQVAALRHQISRLTTALDASDTRNSEQQVEIASLGTRLNEALATKVEELSRYRSEFFGKLREVLGNRPDIRVVGDRFVFQSEVLFPTASAQLEDAGKAKLAQLAKTWLELSTSVPPGVNWVLRIDGHTDRRPINTPQFHSNWELSTARAISVVRQLVELGVPPERLAAAGFGEYQPLDSSSSEDALARNRRIEIKLDQR